MLSWESAGRMLLIVATGLISEPTTVTVSVSLVMPPSSIAVIATTNVSSSLVGTVYAAPDVGVSAVPFLVTFQVYVQVPAWSAASGEFADALSVSELPSGVDKEAGARLDACLTPPTEMLAVGFAPLIVTGNVTDCGPLASVT